MQETASQRLTKRLRALRLMRGWTQEQAAESCGIGYKLYQLYELGVKRNPGLTTLEKLAQGFGLELEELFSTKVAKRRLGRVPTRDVKK